MKIDELLKQSSTPPGAPAFPRGPCRFHNREQANITCRTDIDALRKVVPEPLEVDEPLVRFEVMRMPDTTGFGNCTGCGQAIVVRPGEERGGYLHAMYVDSHPAIASGREISAYPGTLGAPKLYTIPTHWWAPSITASCASRSRAARLRARSRARRRRCGRGAGERPRAPRFESGSLWKRVPVAAPAHALLLSSGSALAASAQARDMAAPERMPIGHSLDPPHVDPAGRDRAGHGHSPEATRETVAFCRALGKTLQVVHEGIGGFVANRLHAAIFREACRWSRRAWSRSASWTRS